MLKLTYGIVLLVHIHTYTVFYRNRQHIFLALSFYKHSYFLPLIHVACIQEELDVVFCTHLSFM